MKNTLPSRRSRPLRNARANALQQRRPIRSPCQALLQDAAEHADEAGPKKARTPEKKSDITRSDLTHCTGRPVTE